MSISGFSLMVRVTLKNLPQAFLSHRFVID